MGHCENTACNDGNNGEPQLSYDVLIDCSDHSGTLRNCRLYSSALETMLGYSVRFLFFLYVNTVSSLRRTQLEAAL